MLRDTDLSPGFLNTPEAPLQSSTQNDHHSCRVRNAFLLPIAQGVMGKLVCIYFAFILLDTKLHFQGNKPETRR